MGTMRILLLLYCLLHAVSALNSEGETLLSLLRQWTWVPPSINSSWQWQHASPSPCLWAGVQCDHHAQHVVSLNLTGFGIAGRLAPEIGNLTQLRRLDLAANSLHGPIPDTLKNLRNLRYISLADNLFTGHFPASLTQLSQLQIVDLSDNNLNGSVPISIGNITQLKILYLQYNQLSGTVPPSIGNCSKLQELFLNWNLLQGVLPQSLNNLHDLAYFGAARNSLTGAIPFPVGSCNNLGFLDLSYNVFSGGIPSGLGNCSGLSELALVNCNLVGRIPSSFGLLTHLSFLRLSNNRLSGTIPSEMGHCKSLIELQLYSNQLEGNIPSDLGNLSKLKDLELFSNRLSGEIPLSIWKIQGLQNVHVYDNHLSGELPLEMTELKHLKNISLFNNRFSGVIPRNLGINSSLVQLDFTNNRLTGNIPPNLCFGKKLSLLTLGINQLQGSMPPGLGSCTTLTRMILKQNTLTGPLPDFESNPNLTYMDISNNRIDGAIPPSLGNCRNLTTLILSANKFSGLIPPQLGKLVNLRTLDLAHNNLEGSVPSQLSNCAKMDKFDVGFNSLNGSLSSTLQSWTGLSTLILRENHFSGGIPSFLSEFKKLSELQLGGNMLGGRIPGSIGALQNLIYGLNLSSNRLIGGIPVEIGNLKKLQILDLSRNNLTGSIQVLDELASLVEINISYNSFRGPVPKMLVKLKNSSLPSFLGNPGLCISCSTRDGLACTESKYLKPCDNKSPKRKGLSKVEIVLTAIGSSIFVILALYAFAFAGKSKHGVNNNNIICGEEGSSSLLNKVMEATDNLNERFVIGRGAHGVVYKALVGPDQAFAVKKLGFGTSRCKKLSMVTEIQTLGRIRHRNLVKVEDFWLRKDFGLILYRYMPNGSLHDVLHEKNPRPVVLEWRVRYKIAVGVSHGLAYLHYDCDPPIVHRDIKPKNILLDSDMEPHIGDFGIAKLLSVLTEESSSSLSSPLPLGTIGYIAPENAYATTTSRESDVYSYGVVLLELLTRKKAADDGDLVGWVGSLWRETAEIGQIVDPGLAQEFIDTHIMEQVTKVLMVALRCTEQDPHNRPPMTLVTKLLSDANPPTTNTNPKESSWQHIASTEGTEMGLAEHNANIEGEVDNMNIWKAVTEKPEDKTLQSILLGGLRELLGHLGISQITSSRL